jgi:hypothetical protein
VFAAHFATRAKIFAFAAFAASWAVFSGPEAMPFTKNFDGCFWRTCQFQRGGIPAICQFPGVTTISRLSSSIDPIWQIPKYFHTGYRHDARQHRVSRG